MTITCRSVGGAQSGIPTYSSWLLLLLLILIVAGCASSGATTEEPDANPAPSEPPSEAAVESVLREAFERWDGVPHRWGGTSRRGVDCSGLLHVWFAGLFDLDLPRTTAEQVQVGDRIDRSRLQAGDLVFFQSTESGRHVGVYLSDDEFAHASASSGVTTSRLDEPYWSSRYWMSRRVLDIASSSQSPSSSEANDAPEDTAPRGW